MSRDGQSLVSSLAKTRRNLFESVEKWRNYGIVLATNERNYRRAYAKMILRLHEEKHVAWTAAIDLAKGMDSVEGVRFERDVAKVQYAAESERINILKIEARILENEIKLGMQGYN